MICKRLTVNQSPSFFFLLSLSSSGAPGALLKERKKIKKDEILVHEKLSSLYNFLLSSLFTFFAPRGASRRAPPKESRELVNKRIVPKEPNFQQSFQRKKSNNPGSWNPWTYSLDKFLSSFSELRSWPLA